MPICNVFTLRKGNKKGREKTTGTCWTTDTRKPCWEKKHFCPCINKQLGKWVGFVAPVVGSAPVSAMVWEEPQQFLGSLWESLVLSGGGEGFPQGWGGWEAARHPKNEPSCASAGSSFWNFGTSYLMITNSPYPKLLANIPSWKGGKLWKDIDSSSVLPVL